MQSIETPRAASIPRMTSVQIGGTAGQRNRGGMDRYFFNLIHALPDHGIDVLGLVVGQTGSSEPGDTVRTFAEETTPLLKRWRAARKAILSDLRRADLLVSHFAPYAFPIIDRAQRRPFVIHFHGPWALESAAEGGGFLSIAVKRLIERAVYTRGARLIVLSRAFGSILEREYGISAEKIRVVPGGVDLERFAITSSRLQAKQALGWPTDRPTVLSVRRLVHAKGLENLIDSIETVRKSIPDVLTVIAGTGPLAPELQRRVSAQGLDRWIRFAGFVPDEQLATLYRAADLFMVPTLTLEGFGLVVLEALACGTPVLVTPVAGLPEVVNDLSPSLVLPGSHADDLARGISDALSGRLAMPAEDVCVRYAQRFSWSNIALRVSNVYRELC